MSGAKDNNQFVTRRFFCNVDGKQHKVKLRKSLLNNHKTYPFTYVLFHGEDDSILTNLFLDANLNIRGVESLPLDENEVCISDNFKKSKVLLKKMAQELIQVRKEYRELNRKYNDLQEEHSTLKFDYALEKIKNSGGSPEDL
jgi:NAD+--asparagine ADP-ribosyltransferase